MSWSGNFSPRCVGLTVLLLIGTSAQPATAADTPVPIGTVFESLTAAGVEYRNAKIRSISARTIMIEHADGLTSLRLRDLTPELQTQFGFNPDAAEAADQALRKAQAEALQRQAAAAKNAPARHRAAQQESVIETLLRQFGRPPEIQSSIDLRPQFTKMKLFAKSQGRRQSCSIFAVVSALEFQNAELVGKTEKLSEEYLIWATLKSLNRATPASADPTSSDSGSDGSDADDDSPPSSDAGFGLLEVVTALSAWGIPLHDSMPNTFGKKMEDIPEPPPEVIAEARSRRRVFVHVLPGRDQPSQLANIIHALNGGTPVVIGLRWPHHRTVRSGFLSQQQPILDYAHAVTIVGYRNKTGHLYDTIFSFKNSYGPDWGMGGYGEVTFQYLSRHLLHAIALEVQNGTHETARR
jgi:hypothetical protein